MYTLSCFPVLQKNKQNTNIIYHKTSIYVYPPFLSKCVIRECVCVFRVKIFLFCLFMFATLARWAGEKNEKKKKKKKKKKKGQSISYINE